MFKCIFLLCPDDSVFWLVVINLLKVLDTQRENTSACIYCTLWFGCCFSCFVFFLSATSPEKLWILFSDTVLSTSCIYFTSREKKPNNMFCSFTKNKKKIFSSILFCFFLLFWLFQKLSELLSKMGSSLNFFKRGVTSFAQYVKSLGKVFECGLRDATSTQSTNHELVIPLLLSPHYQSQDVEEVVSSQGSECHGVKARAKEAGGHSVTGRSWSR